MKETDQSFITGNQKTIIRYGPCSPAGSSDCTTGSDVRNNDVIDTHDKPLLKRSYYQIAEVTESLELEIPLIALYPSRPY